MDQVITAMKRTVETVHLNKVRSHLQCNLLLFCTVCNMLFCLITGLCGWNDTSKGAYDWNRDRGGTPSTNTGPNVDHTLGNQHDLCLLFNWLGNQLMFNNAQTQESIV